MTAPEPFRVLVADDEPMLLDSYRYVIDDLSPRRDRMTELEEQLFGPARRSADAGGGVVLCSAGRSRRRTGP